MALKLVFALIATIVLQQGYCFDLVELVPAGTLPTPRGYTNAIYDGDDSIFIVGGEHIYNDYEELSDILRYNLTTGLTTLAGALPKPSKLGALTPSGNGSFIYSGGFGNNTSSPHNDIFQFSSDNTTAYKIGELPFPRVYHSATYDEAGSIYIVGGSRGDDDILKYVVSTGEISGAGNIPPTANTRVASAYVDGFVYVFGDMVYKFDPKTYRLENTGVKFDIIYTAIVAAGQDIYVIGGHNTSDFYKFNTVKETLEVLVVRKFPYGRHVLTPGVAYVEKLNRIYIFGGWGTGFHNEVYYIQL